MNNQASVSIWGTGTPRREFLCSKDMAYACTFLMRLPDVTFATLINNTKPPLVNIGCGEDLAIKELAGIIKKVVNYTGELTFDTSKPDGTMRKLMDVSLINRLGWKAHIGITEGISDAYESFLGCAS